MDISTEISQLRNEIKTKQERVAELEKLKASELYPKIVGECFGVSDCRYEKIIKVIEAHDVKILYCKTLSVIYDDEDLQYSLIYGRTYIYLDRYPENKISIEEFEEMKNKTMAKINTL